MKHIKPFLMLISFAVLLLGSGRVYAVATGIGDAFPQLMRGVRPLGMGNAFLAMPGSDFIAPFYNPAAINDFENERKYSVDAPMADFNQNAFDAAFDLLDLKHNLKNGLPNDQKIALFSAYTDKYIGQFNTLMTSMPIFQVRHKRYALSVVGDYRLTLSFRNVAFPNFDFKTAASAGVVAGSAYGFWDERIQIGGNIKFLYRMGKEDEITSADIIVNSIHKLIGFQTWQRGVGVGLDAGIKFKIPFLEDILHPAVGATVFDIGNTRFTGDAPQMPMSVSAGLGIFPKIDKVEFALLADFRELNKEMDFLNRVHFGVEAIFPEIKKIRTKLSVRAGCNQGYPSAGFTARWPLVSFLFAFYGEEAGQYSRRKASYRFSNQLSFEF